MAGADLDKQPDSHTSVLKVSASYGRWVKGVKLALPSCPGASPVSKSTVITFTDHENHYRLYIGTGRKSEILSHPQAVRTGRASRA